MFNNSVLEKEVINFRGIDVNAIGLNKVGHKFAISIEGDVDGCFVSESYLYSNESDRDNDYELVLDNVK